MSNNTHWQQGHFIDGREYRHWSEKQKQEAENRERLLVRPSPKGNAICQAVDPDAAIYIAEKMRKGERYNSLQTRLAQAESERDAAIARAEQAEGERDEISGIIMQQCDNEGTRLPWWCIIDPQQNLSTKPEASHNIAGMVTGPFFSRERAERFLKATRYNFGKGAVVYCMSGHNSHDYERLYNACSAIIERGSQ
jgi:hypothetical protein